MPFFTYTPNLTDLYVRIMDEANDEFYSTVAADYEAWQDGHVTNYDVALTEVGTSGVYKFTIPAADAEARRLLIVAYRNATPSITDVPIGAAEVVYNGSAEEFVIDLNGRTDVGQFLSNAVVISGGYPDVNTELVVGDTPMSTNDAADAVWDEVLTGATHNIPTSAGKRLRQAEDATVVHDGTAQGAGGGNNTIQLDADANPTDNFYEEDWVVIESGTGAGQMRHIDTYDGTTKIATVGRDWFTNPNATSVFLILGRSSVHVHEIETNALAQINAVDNLVLTKKIAECDMKIDKSSTPWVIVFYEKGTATEIMKKKLLDIDGNNVAASNVVVGRHIHTT